MLRQSLEGTNPTMEVTAPATILVVEDEAGPRALMREVLEMKGYVVLTAGDGLEGITVADQYDGPIHLVITDLLMPRLGGQAMVKRLLPAHPSLRVLYISGYADEKTRTALGLDAPILTKPFVPEALLTKVREVLK
jgi:two-component system, cell cycle sensor histidine kinase and response regulator CckA